MTLKISKWLFLLLIISLPLVRPFNVQIFGFLVPYTDFIFLLSALFWLIAVLRRETSIKFDKFYIFLGFYAFALIVSTVFSVEPSRSFYKLLGEFYLFGLAVLTFNLVREKQFFKQIAAAWLIGTSLTILASIAGFVLFYLGYKTQADNYFLSHFGSLPAGNYPRIHALFANANMMCDFLNVSLMLALLAEKLEWLKKIWAKILQFGIWFAAFFTLSAGLGGMFLSLGVWYWVLFKEKKNYLFSKIALAGAVLLAVFIFAATLISPNTDNTSLDFYLPFSDKKFEASVRVLVWESVLDTVYQFPLVGKGTGTNTALVSYDTLSGDKQILLDAHNNWLSVLGQTGLLGLTAFVLLNVFLITRCRFSLEKADEQNLIQIALSCAFLGAFLYQGLSGSFEDARHLWILIGLLVGISNFKFQISNSRTSKNDISEESTMP